MASIFRKWTAFIGSPDNSGPVHLETTEQTEQATTVSGTGFFASLRNSLPTPDLDSGTSAHSSLSYFERISLFVFAAVWSLGSVLFLTAFAVLQGPSRFAAKAITRDALPYTLVFTVSIVATLAAAFAGRHGLILLLCCAIQITATIVYTVSHLPGGRLGVQTGASLAGSRLQGWLNN
ncbi:hypothetical protein CANINC_001255 [Pichia inconspicua]|uniref:Protein transport protein SFT2 n=1 Tax=Pichia inconspicua TaxID=52247 RepID=A0A4T0X4J3_9ASCO|nr:hypothetical protein CANINC_001255 [[Candida] inconspicua]